MKNEINQIREEVLLRGAQGLLTSQLMGLILSNTKLGRSLTYNGNDVQIHKVKSPLRQNLS